ncbi:hypothetical protein [Vreelandella sp. GE22]
MTDKPKGGPYAKRAAVLCANTRFGLYLDQRRRRVGNLNYEHLPDGTHSPGDCADWIRQACGVESRAEIDHSDAARAMLDRITADYQSWERFDRMQDRIVGGAHVDCDR